MEYSKDVHRQKIPQIHHYRHYHFVLDLILRLVNYVFNVYLGIFYKMECVYKNGVQPINIKDMVFVIQIQSDVKFIHSLHSAQNVRQLIN
jgi:hypothetical protein